MNIREKCIEAMYEAFGKQIARHNFEPAIDAALAVLADNWTEGMNTAAMSLPSKYFNQDARFAAVIKHVRGME